MSRAPSRKVIHADQDLQTASDYLEYHVRMYVETLRGLRDRAASGVPKDIMWNAVLEDHLIHARLLIDFLRRTYARKDDILAIDFFHDMPNVYQPLRDDFLKTWADNVGGRLVHITTKPMPALKSHQEWPIIEVADRLVPGLAVFLSVVPEARLVDGARSDCLRHLGRLDRQETRTWRSPIPPRSP